jgi:hypothetical protein
LHATGDFKQALVVLRTIVASVLIATLVTACASERNYRTLPPGEGPPVPQSVEVRQEVSISTVHFPPGVYALHAEDDAGYYYRSPRQLTKHAFAGFQQYDGGVFIRKGNRPRVRGYIVWAGGRTKIGELDRDDYELR